MFFDLASSAVENSTILISAIPVHSTAFFCAPLIHVNSGVCPEQWIRHLLLNRCHVFCPCLTFATDWALSIKQPTLHGLLFDHFAEGFCAQSQTIWGCTTCVTFVAGWLKRWIVDPVAKVRLPDETGWKGCFSVPAIQRLCMCCLVTACLSRFRVHSTL